MPLFDGSQKSFPEVLLTSLYGSRVSFAFSKTITHTHLKIHRWKKHHSLGLDFPGVFEMTS
jgi:hypothetical protein